jgi:hypothetical protein
MCQQTKQHCCHVPRCTAKDLTVGAKSLAHPRKMWESSGTSMISKSQEEGARPSVDDEARSYFVGPRKRQVPRLVLATLCVAANGSERQGLPSFALSVGT